eukprot:5140546-Alexandrium_andersonii.AAC.1
MSASLVGSEMCIRDSPQREPPHQEGSDSPTGPTPNHGEASRCRTRALPVSYTHLTLPTICSV